jgi:hypothetical protein
VGRATHTTTTIRRIIVGQEFYLSIDGVTAYKLLTKSDIGGASYNVTFKRADNEGETEHGDWPYNTKVYI